MQRSQQTEAACVDSEPSKTREHGGAARKMPLFIVVRVPCSTNAASRADETARSRGTERYPSRITGRRVRTAAPGFSPSPRSSTKGYACLDPARSPALRPVGVDPPRGSPCSFDGNAFESATGRWSPPTCRRSIGVRGQQTDEHCRGTMRMLLASSFRHSGRYGLTRCSLSWRTIASIRASSRSMPDAFRGAERLHSCFSSVNLKSASCWTRSRNKALRRWVTGEHSTTIASRIDRGGVASTFEAVMQRHPC